MNYPKISQHYQDQIKELMKTPVGERCMKGNTLRLFYKLVQLKGDLIITDPSYSINGIKAMQINETEFVAFKRTGFTKNSFYPCMIETFILKTF